MNNSDRKAVEAEAMDAIGPYVLEELLGTGGMGQVYRARHRLLNIERAVKVLAPEVTRDSDFRERFLEEGRIAVKLRHPNIVPVHDLGEENNQLYLVMDYVPGQSLSTLLRESGPMPMDRAIGLLAQVADALSYVHAQGIVHRDLKPANLMVRPDNTVQVVDFGIAKAMEGTRLTQTGGIVGTMFYVAPERLMHGATGASIDLYALGVIAYETLLNRLRFTTTDAARRSRPSPSRSVLSTSRRGATLS